MLLLPAGAATRTVRQPLRLCLAFPSSVTASARPRPRRPLPVTTAPCPNHPTTLTATPAAIAAIIIIIITPSPSPSSPSLLPPSPAQAAFLLTRLHTLTSAIPAQIPDLPLQTPTVSSTTTLPVLQPQSNSAILVPPDQGPWPFSRMFPQFLLFQLGSWARASAAQWQWPTTIPMATLETTVPSPALLAA